MLKLILIGLFLVEFFLLFLSSRLLTRWLTGIIYSVTKNKTITVYIFAFIFLPGTIIHELSHFLMAAILFVPIGKIELFPVITKTGVRLGSVEIGKTDVLRRLIIGIAPLILGFAIIISLILFLKDGFGNTAFFWQKAFLFYAVFEIGNTMFSSKKDLEGAVIFLVSVFMISLAIFITFYFTHNLSFFSWVKSLNSEKPIELLKNADLFLLVPLGINALAFGVAKILETTRNNITRL